MRRIIQSDVVIVILMYLVILVPADSRGALDYSSVGSTYQQNFDGLAANSSVTHTWTSAETDSGWQLFRATSNVDSSPIAVTDYEASNGASDAGHFYSFGATGDSDRALGALGNGSFGGGNSYNFNMAIGWIALGVTNLTGTTLSRFSIHYDGEQWRDASVDPQTMVFEYGFGNSFESVASWTTPLADEFHFVSPVNNGAGAAVNGNTAGLQSNRGGTVDSLSWDIDQTLWLRWIELNDAGTDHALAIDNVTFSASAGISAVPEPAAFLFGVSASGLVIVFLTIRRTMATLRK